MVNLMKPLLACSPSSLEKVRGLDVPKRAKMVTEKTFSHYLRPLLSPRLSIAGCIGVVDVVVRSSVEDIPRGVIFHHPVQVFSDAPNTRSEPLDNHSHGRLYGYYRTTESPR